MLYGSLPDIQLAQVCMRCVLGAWRTIQATLAHTHNLARIHNIQVPEAGSAGNDGDMLNQHVSLLASLAPVVRETIHPDGTRQAARPHTPLITYAYLLPPPVATPI